MSTAELIRNMSDALGAIVTDSGTAFRVWAPNAETVSVVGSFNDWNETANPCERDENGNWFALVENASGGDEYRYCITRGDKKLLRIDPRARQVTNSVGNGVIADHRFDWDEEPFEFATWNELVIYEMHIGTFGGSQGHVGTFDDAIAKLAYLHELGVNAIELMPLSEFAGDYSWGYNPAHPFAVETAYGGPEGLKRFIRSAHRLGIGVIVDVVYNHFGPSDLDIWQFDGWSENDKGGIYFFNDWRSSTPWGDTRPDYARQEVRQYIFDNAMMWLEEYNADGLRYDMTLYMRSVDGDEGRAIHEGFTLAQWINTEVQRRYPNKITIAEDLRNNASLTASIDESGANFSAQWCAEFVHPVRKALIEIDDANRSMDSVLHAATNKLNNDAFRRVIYTESHDEVANGKQRVVSEIDPSETPNRYAVKRSTLGAGLMFTSPGIPMLFQGQEFLFDKWFRDDRPILWDMADRNEGVLHLYHDLIALRRNASGFSGGLTGQHFELLALDDSSKLIAFRRWKEGGPKDDVVVVMHFAEGRLDDVPIPMPRPGLWKLRFNSDAKIYHPSLDDTSSADVETTPLQRTETESATSALITVGAYSCLIYSQDD